MNTDVHDSFILRVNIDMSMRIGLIPLCMIPV